MLGTLYSISKKRPYILHLVSEKIQNSWLLLRDLEKKMRRNWAGLSPEKYIKRSGSLWTANFWENTTWLNSFLRPYITINNLIKLQGNMNYFRIMMAYKGTNLGNRTVTTLVLAQNRVPRAAWATLNTLPAQKMEQGPKQARRTHKMCAALIP